VQGNQHKKELRLKLLLDRFLQGLVVLFLVSGLAFALLAAAGGDALDALQQSTSLSGEALARLRSQYGLDQPLTTRYVRWLASTLQGDFGYSLYFQTPVANLLWPRLLRTLALGGVALLFAWTVSLSLGLLSVRRAGSWLDRGCEGFVLLASATPRLLLALLALVLAVRTGWYETGGALDGLGPAAFCRRLLAPAFVLSVPLIAVFLAQTREAIKSALETDYIRAARAKGLPEHTILLRHALRPALNPLLTVFGYALGGVLSGAVIVEQVLGWPGLGELSVIAVRSRDVPLLLGVVLVTSTAVLVGNLLADLLLRLNDPRLR
jgi:peptide/nickel transport system permease protein